MLFYPFDNRLLFNLKKRLVEIGKWLKDPFTIKFMSTKFIFKEKEEKLRHKNMAKFR